MFSVTPDVSHLYFLCDYVEGSQPRSQAFLFHVPHGSKRRRRKNRGRPGNEAMLFILCSFQLTSRSVLIRRVVDLYYEVYIGTF